MKTKSNTIISAAAATLALLAACGERDYTKDSPFDNATLPRSPSPWTSTP